MTENHKIIVSALRDAELKIKAINDPSIANLLNRVLAPIEREIGIISNLIDTNISSVQVKDSAFGPLTNILGRKVNTQLTPVLLEERNQDQAFKERQQIASDVEVEEYRKKRDDLYPVFLTTTSAKLLDENPDIVLRAVAKLVGLPVTNTLPLKLDVKFIDMVKDAIKKTQAVLDASNDKQ